MKITGDYGFYEHSKFIAKNKTEFDKFEKHLNEYKELMKDEPKAIKEAYINPIRTLEESIPNFLAHHSQTPYDLISKKKSTF